MSNKIQLENLARVFPDLHFILDREGIFLQFLGGDEARKELYTDPATFLGKGVHEILPPQVAALFSHAIQKIVAGENETSFEYTLPIPGRGEQSYEARCALMSEGQFLFVCRNITDRRDIEVREEILESASKVLCSSVDYHGTLKALLHIVVPKIADYAILRFYSEKGEVERLEQVCGTTDRAPILQEICVRFSWSQQIASSAVRSRREGKSVLVTQTTDEYFRSISQGAQQLDLLRRLDVKSALSVSIALDHGCVGTYSLGRFSNRPSFTADDQALMEELATRSGIAIRYAVLQQQAFFGVEKMHDVISETRKNLDEPIERLEKGAFSLRNLVNSLEDRQLAKKMAATVSGMIREIETVQSALTELIEASKTFAGPDVEEIRPVQLAVLVETAISKWHDLAIKKNIQISTHLDHEVSDVLCKSNEMGQSLQKWLGGVMKALPQGATLDLSYGKKNGDTVLLLSAEKSEHLEQDIESVRELIELWGGHAVKPTHSERGAVLGFSMPTFRPN